MDKLVDHIFVFEGNGIIKDIWGNYSQAREKMRKGVALLPSPSRSEAETIGRGIGGEGVNQQSANLQSKRKLSYHEQREFDKLSTEIEILDKRKEEINLLYQNG